MTFDLSPAQFDKLDAELLASHQVIVTPATPDAAKGTITSLDGKIAAFYNFTQETHTLDVTLTKHDGTPGFLANAVLKSKLNAAIKAL